MLKIGCCGFPVSQETYFRTFPTVEINSTFYNLPRLSTARSWREKAPKDFVFTLKAWQLITHHSSSPTYQRLSKGIPEKKRCRCGLFLNSEEVFEAWEKTAEIARIIGCRVILFQTPSRFYPNTDLMRNMYGFFKRIRREQFLFVWEPRGKWDDSLVRRICKDLNLVHCVDPLNVEKSSPSPLSMKYFRLHGAYEGRRILYAHTYTEDELRRLKDLCVGRHVYVFFNNVPMWQDAQRFQKMEKGDGSIYGKDRVPFSTINRTVPFS